MALTQTKQQIHSEEVKTRILEKARELFFTYGVENVSMKDLAGELGFTTGTIYHHFESKDDILRHIALLNAKQYYVNFDRYMEMPSKAEAVSEFFHKDMMHRILSDGYVFTRYRVLNLMKPGRKNRMADRLAEIISKGIESGEFKKDIPAEDLAWMFISLHRQSCYEYALSEGDEYYLQKGLDQIDYLLKSVTVR